MHVPSLEHCVSYRPVQVGKQASGNAGENVITAMNQANGVFTTTCDDTQDRYP